LSFLILPEAASLRVGTLLQRHVIAVGALALGRAKAPELGDARLVLRVGLERLSVDEHRLAVQVHAARAVFVGHGGNPHFDLARFCDASQKRWAEETLLRSVAKG